MKKVNRKKLQNGIKSTRAELRCNFYGCEHVIIIVPGKCQRKLSDVKKNRSARISQLFWLLKQISEIIKIMF